MTTQEMNTDASEYFADHADEFIDIGDRDYACVLLPNLDYEAQLNAIKDLLQRHMRAEQLLSEEIVEIEAHARQLSGYRNQRAVDEWVDRMHASVYQDAAHSMAAVGMLAPLIESIFHQAFLGTKDYYSAQSLHLLDHPRWQINDKCKWDCHYIWREGKKSKNLVEGIFELVDAVGMSTHLPKNIRPKLEAFFTYRNLMFHNGFEWPLVERHNFAEKIKSKGWSDSWFKASTSDGRPWIYYMTETYISDCVLVIEQILDAFGSFVRQRCNRASGNGQLRI